MSHGQPPPTHDPFGFAASNIVNLEVNQVSPTSAQRVAGSQVGEAIAPSPNAWLVACHLESSYESPLCALTTNNHWLFCSFQGRTCCL
jgi:hypothetical protein